MMMMIIIIIITSQTEKQKFMYIIIKDMWIFERQGTLPLRCSSNFAKYIQYFRTSFSLHINHHFPSVPLG